ncbi:LysM peptidoglycan-binding domain-containing protein [Aeromicrobium alkaliterrae]|uniref:LysM domain-containing protein n=1 Tax=Aeromicrobium alkaliterrae TaxID=302168 RepID=A0ABP4VST4_9ACTN
MNSSQRRGLLTTAGATAGLALAAPGLPDAPRQLRGGEFADVLAGGTTLALAALAAWLLVAALLVLTAEHTGAGTTAARRLAPRWLAAGLTTGALVLGPTAQATPGDLDGLPLPDRASVAVTTAAPEAPAPAPAEAAPSVTVQAGDCLWDLARRHAPAGTPDAALARLTALWHEQNLAVIGADPDVLVPGQVLVVPTGLLVGTPVTP